MNDFAQCLRKIIGTMDETGPEVAELLRAAEDVYKGFVECDSDGNGRVSRDEFLDFAAQFGYERTDAEALFDDLDTNNDGERATPGCSRCAVCIGMSSFFLSSCTFTIAEKGVCCMPSSSM